MNIEFPATLTARYEPDTWTENYYDTNGSGTIYIEFGNDVVQAIRIERNGEQYENNSYGGSRGEANENLNAYVATFLRKIFQNALAIGG